MIAVVKDDDPDGRDSEQPLGSALARYLGNLFHTAGTQDRTQTYAYRGQDNDSWPLQSAAARRLERSNQMTGQQDNPSLPKQALQYHTQHLLREFRNLGHDIVDGRRQSDLQCLSTLQHQGAATPLLDFSSSPLVALWFASQDGDIDTDGRVFKMNITTCQTDHNGGDADTSKSFKDILEDLQYPRENLAWKPPSLGDSRQRVLAQQSVHLLCKHDLEHCYAVSSRHLTEITIAASDKQQLRDDLRAIGIDEEALFPDLSGFARINSSETPLRRPDPSELLLQANAAYNDGNFDLAADSYSRYLETYPDDNRVKLLLTNAMVDARHPQEALDLLSIIEPWIQSNLSEPEKLNFYFNKANVEAELGEHRPAIEDYTKSLGLGARLDAYFNRANSYASIGEYDKAISDYQSCPSHASAKFNAGNASTAKRDFEGAERYFSLAVEMDPMHDAYVQNRDVIRQMRMLLDGRKYDIRLEQRTTGTASPTILIFVEAQGAESNPAPHVFSLAGSVGNQGNAGYLNLRGGRGFQGSMSISVLVLFSRDKAQY